MLVWTDLETTGLAPAKERVLEVAAVITDDALNEVARFSRVTTEARYHILSEVDPYVLKMHVDNGLWNESLLAPSSGDSLAQGENHGHSLEWVDIDLAMFIAAHCAETGEKKGPQLAGSTISFDRAFMQVHLPAAHALLSYRNVDVSSFNEIAKRFWPDIHAARPRGNGGVAKHRALDDVLESLEVMRYYVRTIGIHLPQSMNQPNVAVAS